MAKLSIIVPVYNAEKYLDQCVKSILAQTFPDFELVLVNDGSTDSSAALCDDWAAKDMRVKVIHKPNGGPQSAVNEGVRQAASDIIGFCDSDDYVARDYYETLYEAMMCSGTDLACCGLRIVYDGSISDYESDRSLSVFNKEAVQREFWENSGRCLIGNNRYNKLFRKDFLLQVLPETMSNLCFGEDAVLSHLYLEKCRDVCILERYNGYFYRQVPSSLINNFREKQIDDNIDYVKAMEQIGATYGHRFLTRNRFNDVLMANLLYRCLISDVGISEKCRMAKRIRAELVDQTGFLRTNLKNLNPMLKIGFYLIQRNRITMGVWYCTAYRTLVRLFVKK